jgi:hypothetical protein
MRPALLVGGVALAAGLALGWLARRPAPAPEAVDATAIQASLERLELAQARQDERLARLEARAAPSTALPAAARTSLSGKAGAARRSNARPARAVAEVPEQLRQYEAKLVADPLSPAWAVANERLVTRFLSPASLARENLAPPRDSEVRCQSRLCRVRLSFPDEASASRMQASLLMALAPGLPHAQSFLLPQPDGSVELVVFAAGDAQMLR